MCFHTRVIATEDQRLDSVFAALADPTRRGIIAQLTHGEATVSELAAPYRMSTQSISQHLKVLENAGLISRGRVRQTRPCRLEAAAMTEAAAWIESAQQEWADRLDRLEVHVRQEHRA